MAATRRRSKRSAAEPVSGRSSSAGQELDEPEQAEGQLAVGDVVDLLAERGGLQRRGRRRRGRREQERDDGSVADQLTPARRGRRRSTRAGPPSGDGSAAWYTGRDELTRRRDPLDGRRRPGRAGRQGRGDPDRAAGGRDRADRGDRPGAQRPRPSRWFDHARELAADPALPDGPFRGVPFLLKDLYTAFAGQTLSNGNVALKAAGDRRPADTTLVARYRAAGLVDRRAHEQPGDGQPADDPAGGVGPDAQPVGPRAHAGRVERRVRRRRSPPGWCRSPTPPTAAGASASRRRPAGSSGSSRARAGSRVGPVRAEVGLGVEHCVSRTVRDTAALLDAVRGPGVGDTVIASAAGAAVRRRGRRRSRPAAHRPARPPPARRVPRTTTASPPCRGGRRMLEGLGHDVAAGVPRDASATSR